MMLYREDIRAFDERVKRFLKGGDVSGSAAPRSVAELKIDGFTSSNRI